MPASTLVACHQFDDDRVSRGIDSIRQCAVEINDNAGNWRLLSEEPDSEALHLSPIDQLTVDTGTK